MSPYMCVYCTHDGERQVTWPTHLRYKASFHVLHFNTLVPAPEVSFADARNNPLRKLTTRCSWNDSSGAETRVLIFDKYTAAS